MSIGRCTNACWLGTCCVALLSWAGSGRVPVFAAEYDVGGGYALARDSDITRGTTSTKCPSPPCPEWTEQLFGGLAYTENSTELTARLLAQVEKRHFVRDVYPDDSGFFLDGAAVWTISPRFFTWTVQDVYRELNTSPTDPATPATLQKTNSLSTGPEFTFRVNPTDTPTIGARYGQFRLHGTQTGTESTGDSDRYTLYALWLHQMSAATTLSPNLVATRIHFEPPALYSDISREDYFFRANYVQPNVRQTADVGTTRLVEYGGQDYNGKLLRYTGQWVRTTESALRIFLADQISDTYTDAIQNQDYEISTIPSIRGEAAAMPITVTNFAIPDIYHSQLGELTYANRNEALGYTVEGHLRRVDYATLPNDYSEKGGRISLSWLFSEEAQAFAFTQYVKRTFSSLDEQDAYRDMAVGMIYKLGRTLSLRLEAGRQERQSNLPQSSFVDNRVMMVLGYSTGPLFSPQPRR